MGETQDPDRGTFRDAKGHTWTFLFGYGTFRRVLQETGIDLLKPIPRGKEIKEDDDEEPLIMQLDREIVMMIDVIYSCLKPQLEGQAVTPEDFGENRVPPEYFPAVAKAFWEGYLDFFQKIGWVDVVEAIQKQTEVTQGIREKSVAKIRKLAELTLGGFDAKADKIIEDVAGEMSQ